MAASLGRSVRGVATPEDVESTLLELIARLDGLDPGYRAMLPNRRTIEAECPDLGLVYHAHWRAGHLSELCEGSAERADIRITCNSDDLLALARRELAFGEAYATNRISIRASMTDLLRLRAAM